MHSAKLTKRVEQKDTINIKAVSSWDVYMPTRELVGEDILYVDSCRRSKSMKEASRAATVAQQKLAE